MASVCFPPLEIPQTTQLYSYIHDLVFDKQSDQNDSPHYQNLQIVPVYISLSNPKHVSEAFSLIPIPATLGEVFLCPSDFCRASHHGPLRLTHQGPTPALAGMAAGSPTCCFFFYFQPSGFR